MDSIISLNIWQVSLAYIFVVIVLAIVRIRGIRREKEIILSSVRMTLQLVLVGFLLVYVFDRPNPFITAAIILTMEAFAIFTVIRKFRSAISKSLKLVIAFSMSVGTILCLAYFLFGVVRISPWYDPRYFIPIAGMIIGNSMTGISLGTKSLVAECPGKRT